MLVIFSMLMPAGAPVQGADQPPQDPPPAGFPAPATAPIESPVVARVYYSGRADLDKLAGMLDIWESHPDQGYVLAMLSPSRFASLAAEGYRIEIDLGKTALLSQVNTPLPGQTNGIPGFPCYRTVEETYTSMAALATDHPNLASWNVIGQSWDKAKPGGPTGYDINVLVLTNKARTAPKPKFFLMAEIHAREYTTAETAARFAEYLVNNYGSNPDVTWLLDYNEVHILPMTNPDGRKFAETGIEWRKNTDNDDGCTTPNLYGTDLNRNSSFKWGGAGSSSNPCDEIYHGPVAGSEPETQAVQNYVTSILPDLRGPADTDPAPDTYPGLFLTLHSYSDLVLYPWGWTNTPAPNMTGLATLGRKFGYYNHYTVEQSIGLYPTTGTTDDWAYGTLGVPAFTFEMGTAFFQDCSYYENTIYPDNFKAILYGAKTTRMPYKLSGGPEVINLAATPPAVKQGASFTLAGRGDDTRYSSGETTFNIIAARYSVDTPSWDPAAVTYPMQPADGAWDSKTEDLTATVSTSGWSAGRHQLFVEAQDASGAWGVPTAIFVDIATFGLNLTPAADAQEVARGASATYSLRVTNTGNAADTFSVGTASTLGWAVTAPASVGPVQPGVYQDFTVGIAVPADVTGITPDVTTVTLTSSGDNSQAAASTLTTTAMLYNFTLAPASATGMDTPGKTVTYHLTLTSTGALADSYSLQTASSLGWTVTAPASLGPVQPGENEDVEVSVTIPPGYTGSTPDVTTVTVTSSNNPGKVHTAALTTTVSLYGVGLAPDTTAQNALQGKQVVYRVLVTNEGVFTDTFTVTVTGGEWAGSLPAVIGPLSSKGGTTLYVVVTVPAGTPVGTKNVLTLTFTSQNSPATVKSVILTTTVISPYQAFLPVVRR